nr:hypothetical protein [Tanacetum cinerariifolium]GEX32993.1 hypothetical protein [Tanacetum cinerariifolium]
MYMKEWVKNMAENPFRNRMFPHIEAKSVKLSDVIAIFDKMREKSLVLEDNDAVKICLLAIPATNVYVSKHPREKISRAFVWKMILPFSWARCRTLFVGDNLFPPLETLTPTKAESESDWWNTSLEYFEGKDVQSEAVSEQLKIEKDALSEEVQNKKKRKRGSSPPSCQNPTYDQLITTVSTLEDTVTTLTQTVLSLQSSIDTKDAAKDVTKDAVKDTISVPMTTTEDTIHIDAAAQDTFCTEDELQFIGMEKGDKPNYDLLDLSKIKRNKYPIYSTFEKKKTDCYLDCLPKGRTCEPSFWDILYPGGKKAEYLEERKLDGLSSSVMEEA